MKSTNQIARTMGILFLMQLGTAFLVNFGLLSPMSSEFMENAADKSFQATVGALMYGGLGALAAAIAIVAYPVLKKYSHSLSLWFLSLSIVSFSLFVVECATLMSMLSLSQKYVTSVDAIDSGVFNAIGGVVRDARIWAHFTNVLVGSFMILVFYIIMSRYKLIPDILSFFGLAAAVLHVIAVVLPFFGYASIVLLIIALPLALGQLLTATWLIVKGFKE